MDLKVKFKNVIKRLIRKSEKKVNKKVSPPVKQKNYESWLSRCNNLNPNITFIIQAHNKSEEVIKIVAKLRAYKNAEIIVIEDGSKIEHLNKLGAFMTLGNEFILRANDLYEIVMYDKAIYMARGNYVVLMQDDDDFDSLEWVDEGLGYFEKFKDLAILGGKNGIDLLPIEVTPDKQRGIFEVDGVIAQRKNSFKLKFTGLVSESNNQQQKFQFVQGVNRPPMWIDRNKFMDKLHHIDQSFAPFMWDEVELCIRAYKAGFKVGWYDAAFKSITEGGMRIYNDQLHHRQDEANAKKLYNLYGEELDEIQSLVDKANLELLNAEVGSEEIGMRSFPQM
jgi:GT2 family glycosyltransferase